MGHPDAPRVDRAGRRVGCHHRTPIRHAHPHGLFFTDSRGGLLREPNFLRDRWRPLLRRAGFVEQNASGKNLPLKGLTPHVLRHSRASLIAARHSELFAAKLQRFLGHHSVIFTLKKYGSHFSKGMLEPEEYLTDLDVAELGDPGVRRR